MLITFAICKFVTELLIAVSKNFQDTGGLHIQFLIWSYFVLHGLLK